jgi:hypothetical protein
MASMKPADRGPWALIPAFPTNTIVGWLPVFTRPEAVNIC